MWYSLLKADKEYINEVFNMLLTEWNQDEALEVARKEGREEAWEECMEFAARNALTKGIPVQEITGLDMNAIEAIRAKF